MKHRRRVMAALIAITGCGLAASPAGQVTAPQVAANDNRQEAGSAANGTVTVSLVAGRGKWRPEEGDGPALDVAAFGEEGGSLRTPGPLLRAPEGAEMVVRVRNTLSDSLQIHGFVTRPASDDAVLSVPAGEMREVRFAVGAPGTYFYWASTVRSTLTARKAIESQLGGALIVDRRGDASADRVFVMTEWDDTRVRIDELVTPEVRRVFAINGFLWPHTERLDERVGRAVRWRIVNLTQAGHPMHLHGFYFTVQAVGTGLADTVYQPGAYRLVVTELMAPDGTMQLAWTPERVGNWLFHCHLGSAGAGAD